MNSRPTVSDLSTFETESRRRRVPYNTRALFGKSSPRCTNGGAEKKKKRRKTTEAIHQSRGKRRSETSLELDNDSSLYSDSKRRRDLTGSRERRNHYRTVNLFLNFRLVDLGGAAGRTPQTLDRWVNTIASEPDEQSTGRVQMSASRVNTFGRFGPTVTRRSVIFSVKQIFHKT